MLFRFDNTYYREKNGIVIGLLPASDISIQAHRFYEVAIINAIFMRYLHIDSRFIDDKLGL